jgi:hypothetical protein
MGTLSDTERVLVGLDLRSGTCGDEGLNASKSRGTMALENSLLARP